MVKRHEDKEDKAQYLRLLSPKVWEDLFRLNFFFFGGGWGGGAGFTWGLIADHARREEKFHICIFQ